MLNGYDFDATMLRIACMNLLLHGVRNPGILNRDALAEDHAGEEEKYSLILANPPFAGNLDFDATSKNLLQIVKTKNTALLFMALFLRLLKPGGRAAVIVPDGILFGSSMAHKNLRKILIEDQKLNAVVSMPNGVFKPYAGVKTAILFFNKTNSGGTDNVWFYDMQADGRTLDDKRDKIDDDDLPDILKRWQNLDKESDRARTDQSFLVPKDEIASNDYDLSINQYKVPIYEEVHYDPPKQIVQNLIKQEKEILEGLKELEGMLN
jgi:type I restriction enzyme M protein